MIRGAKIPNNVNIEQSPYKNLFPVYLVEKTNKERRKEAKEQARLFGKRKRKINKKKEYRKEHPAFKKFFRQSKKINSKNKFTVEQAAKERALFSPFIKNLIQDYLDSHGLKGYEMKWRNNYYALLKVVKMKTRMDDTWTVHLTFHPLLTLYFNLKNVFPILITRDFLDEHFIPYKIHGHQMIDVQFDINEKINYCVTSEYMEYIRKNGIVCVKNLDELTEALKKTFDILEDVLNAKEIKK